MQAGYIKKKRNKSNLLSKIAESVKRYFCFWGMGRFLVYYDDEPVSLTSNKEFMLYRNKFYG
jgi:hypothetical protein